MKFINWGLGLIFLLSGVIAITTNILSAVLLFIIAGLFIPPVRKFAGDKTGIIIPFPVRVVAVLVLMVAAGLVNTSQFEEQAAKEGGFATIEEYKAASAEGIKTNEAYQKSLAEQKILLAKKNAPRISELNKKLNTTAGFLPKIEILEELAALDSDTYESQLSEAKEQLRKHDEQIEADKLARQKREKEREAQKRKERAKRTIGVWIDERWPQPAKFTLLKDAAGAFGELIIEFGDGSTHNSLVDFDKDLKGNLLFKELGNTKGEYYVIKKGILSIYDNQGYVATLLPDMGIPSKE